MSVVSEIFRKYGHSVRLIRSDGETEISCFLCPYSKSGARPRLEGTAPLGAYDESRYLMLAPENVMLEDGDSVAFDGAVYAVLRAEKISFPEKNEHWEAVLQLIRREND